MDKQLSVRVCMYCVGIGDCFLLIFEQNQTTFHMLIDCGVLKGTPNASEIMRAVVADIQATLNGNPLDLLVLTHEHWDHVSGFSQAFDIWEHIPVKQVWAAWTEDDNNRIAHGLRTERAKTRAMLKKVAHALAQLHQTPRFLQSDIESSLSFFGLDSDDDALGADSAHAEEGQGSELQAHGPQTIRTAFDYALAKASTTNGQCRFLPENPASLVHSAESLPDFPGVQVYVLGPPESSNLFSAYQKDEVYGPDRALTLADTYFAGVHMLMNADNAEDQQEDNQRQQLAMPFSEQYARISPEQAATQRFFQKHYFGTSEVIARAPSSVKTSQKPVDISWRQIESDWLGFASDLALNLDQNTNNTSLALAIELGENGKVLLFPGDAQVGSWLSWHDCSWKSGSSSDPNQIITIQDLLRRTVLYKVSHHGSHNATLSTKGLDMMTNTQLVAMIPVDAALAKTKGTRGWDMPATNLLPELIEKTRGRVLRADEAPHFNDAAWKGSGGKGSERMIAVNGDIIKELRVIEYHIMA